MNEDAVKDLQGPDFDRIVNRLITHLQDLEAKKDAAGEASRGWQSNQLDARGNKGGIWYVVESRWSIVAIAIACVALGISIASGGALLSKMVELSRELSR